MWVCELNDAFIYGVGRTDAKNKDRGYERPEEPFFTESERMFARSWSFVEPETEQQKDLIGRVSNRVEGFSHHAGRAGNECCNQLKNRDQSVGKERPQDSQHTEFLRIRRVTVLIGLSRKTAVLAMVRYF